LPRDREGEVEGEAAVLILVHSDRTRSEAEKTRVETLKGVHLLKVEHIAFDDGGQLWVLHLKRLARHGNDAIDVGRSNRRLAAPNPSR
jgi:hypothetical protein